LIHQIDPKDDDEESEDEEKENSLPDPQNFGRGRRTALVESKLRMDSTAEEKRKAHQKELMKKMNEEALRRIKAGGDQVPILPNTVFPIFHIFVCKFFSQLGVKCFTILRKFDPTNCM
jgi:nucleosome binding factor SPN SPT16 subunit